MPTAPLPIALRDSRLTLAALLGYLMFLNWKLTLIVVFLFPAVALVMLNDTAQRMEVWSLCCWQQWVRLYGYLK